MRAYYNKDKRKFNEMSYESKYLLDPKYMTKRDLQHYYRYYNITKKRSQFKKIIVIIFCVCLFSYVFVDYNLRTKLMRLRDRFDFIPRIDVHYNTTQAYFVDTPGCRMPYFEVTDDNIVQFITKQENFTCRKPMTRTTDTGSFLLLNMNPTELLDIYNISDIGSVNCSYSVLQRKSENENTVMRTTFFKLSYDNTVKIPPYVELIRVQCFDQWKINFYKDIHFFVVDNNDDERGHSESVTKDDAIDSTTERTRTKIRDEHRKSRVKSKLLSMAKSEEKRRKEKNARIDDQISVMVLGIDSVSHLNFLRQMRRSAAYIRKKLSHIEFWGFNKVGDNTYPNLVPVLSGLDEMELNISCLAPFQKHNYDHCAFIWKRFKEAGYRTVYAEDVASLGLFNYCRNGFQQKPTDFYMRPIMVEMEKHIAEKRSINTFLCMEGRRTVDVLIEYIKKLLPRLKLDNFFSFFWMVTLTHDFFNSPALLDDAFVALLRNFENAGIFNRTFIILMSDHGIRWGSFRNTYQGMMEERQPLLMTIYPKWLSEKYPKALENLDLNSRRLVTPYDLHATMLDLLELNNLQDKSINLRALDLMDPDGPLPRGISLFLPIPIQRTCEQAGIASHWCTCHHRQELQTNDVRVQQAARYLVRLMNEKLKPHPQCRTLYLNSIQQAFIAAPHDKIIKELNKDFAIDITLRLQTKPGLGNFESTVRMNSYSTTLTGTISRLNLYGSQSYCIDDYTLKMFCYCHR